MTTFHFDNSYAKLPSELYSKVNPTPVLKPELLIFNEELAQTLGIGPISAEILSGNEIPAGADPLAQAYLGHQFGHLNMLGDGRAILLGEHLMMDGRRFDIHLKGSGRTPYSRGGDGRAAIGPMLREYIISEAMSALGIPTTRSLAVVATGEQVYREEALQGAILVRIASSHIRVGTFQYVASLGRLDLLQKFTDYTIRRHYPELAENKDRTIQFLEAVMDRQAQLIAQWMHVGFIHGVMNTDNMAVSGETIDYGPCAFMDAYDPKTVFSSIDRRGRYAYFNQPEIAGWNLARFTEALLPLFSEGNDEGFAHATRLIESFREKFRSHWLGGMNAKLGLFSLTDGDQELIQDLLEIMKTSRADYTNTFRGLSGDNSSSLIAGDEFKAWHGRWSARLQKQGQTRTESAELMNSKNPKVIPRNHLVESALSSASQGNMGPLKELLAVLKNPFDEKASAEEFCRGSDQDGYKTFCGT